MPVVTESQLRSSCYHHLSLGPKGDLSVLLNVLLALLVFSLLLALYRCHIKRPQPHPHPQHQQQQQQQQQQQLRLTRPPPWSWNQHSSNRPRIPWLSEKPPIGSESIGLMSNQPFSTVPLTRRNATPDPPRVHDMTTEESGDKEEQTSFGTAPRGQLRVDTGRPWTVKSRPPPPPPLTPPTLSNRALALEHGSASVPRTRVELNANFFQEPNPDYSSASASSESASTALEPKEASPASPMHRSYSKIVPLSSPRAILPTPSSASQTATAGFSPSSFPSSNPSLPIAPHDSLEGPGSYPSPTNDDDSANVSNINNQIDVKGEVISVTDDAGSGWKRHTRVYGGGVCLACMASGATGPGGHREGGFYGANVRPEERR